MNIPYVRPKVYNWPDLQKELCKLMSIEEKYFRDYHKVVGGEYKDLWHVCLENIVPHQMANDTIVTMYGIEDYEGNEEYYLEEHKWAAPLYEAWQRLMHKLDPNFNGILVKFSW